MEIKNTLKNYKCFKEFTVELQNSNLIIFNAKNEKGKTSLITSFKEMVSAKKLTPNPLKEGETEGSIFGQLPDKNGDPVIINILINEEGKYSFTLIDKDGKLITQQTKIREIMGMCTFMTIDEFTRNCQTAKGKRDILETLIYKLLPENEMKEVLAIDKQLTTESELYKLIYNTKEELKSFQIQKSTLALTEDENAILNAGNDIDKEIQERQVKIDEYNKSVVSIATYNQKIEENKRIKTECEQGKVALEQWKARRLAQLKADYEKALQDTADEYQSSLVEINDKEKTIVEPVKIETNIKEEEVIKLKEEIVILQQGKGQKVSVEEKAQKIHAIESSIAPKQKLLLEKENEKEALKNKKLTLLQKVDIPSLTFDEETFYIDGMEISDTQISESKRGLILVELLCRVNETPLIFVGNMSVFDEERAEKVLKICFNNKKIPFFEKVGDTDDIKVITTIEEVY